MSSKLSGSSRASFSFMTANIGRLLVASALPLIFILVIGVGQILVTMDQHVAALAGSGYEASVASIVLQVVLGLIILFFYGWLIAKISRVYLTDEAVSLIGAPGTLRAGFWISLYSLGIGLITVVPLMIVVFAAVYGFFFLTGGGAVQGSIGPAALAVVGSFVAMVLVGWTQCRFVVGYPPLALGQRVGFFDGWPLSKGNSLGLFGRMLAAVLISLVVMMVIFFILTTFGAKYFDPSVAEDLDRGSIRVILISQQAILLLLITPFYWYMVVFFCEAYSRLSSP